MYAPAVNGIQLSFYHRVQIILLLFFFWIKYVYITPSEWRLKILGLFILITFHEVKRVKFNITEEEAKNSTDPNIFVLSLTFICVHIILVTFQKKINFMDSSTFSKVNTKVQHCWQQRHWAVSSTSHNPVHHNTISLPALYRPLNPLIWMRKGRVPEFCMHLLSPHQIYIHRLS